MTTATGSEELDLKTPSGTLRRHDADRMTARDRQRTPQTPGRTILLDPE